MDWLTSNGEIYHRVCTSWSASVETGKCQHCATAIPEPIVRLALDQKSERARVARARELAQKMKAISQRIAEIQTRTDARLKPQSERDLE